MEWVLWVKALHVISVVAWTSKKKYLPRLFVYHADAEPGSELSERFKVMERRLLRAIINPAMVAAYVFGLILVIWADLFDWDDGWVWVKLAGIVVLTEMHHLYARWRKTFAEDKNARPARFYRIANEVPTLAMIVIVIMVIVKPF